MVFFSLRTRNATSRAHAPSLRDFPTRTPAWPPSGASYRIGVHYVRDVLVHILKLTGFYEQASYTIQPPDTIRQYHGRFLPEDKAALTARIS